LAASSPNRILDRIAKLRVPLGFVAGALAIWLARPTAHSIFWGAVIAVPGELFRIWAAGHLNRWKEVARTGPYRFVRHPLYVGSSIMGLGLAVAAASVPVALLVAVYLGVTLSAAVRFEANELGRQFGADYQAYREGRTAAAGTRGFSVRQVIANREYRSAAGLMIGFAILWLKTRAG
jgi:protein-S-isoprenylcysteine O-methyltransferase Ste14